MAKTSADLITNIRRRAQLSQDSGQALSDTDILAMASDELQNVIAPRIYAMRGWHFASLQIYTLTGARYYRIPDRSAGGTIISVEIVNSSPPNRLVNLVHPLQINVVGGQVQGESYYIYNNNIILSSGCPSSGTMLVRFLLPPSQLYQLGLTSLTQPSANTIAYAGGSVTNSPGSYDFIEASSPYEIILAGVPGTASAGLFTSTGGNIFSVDADCQKYSTIENLTAADLSTMSTNLKIVDAGWSSNPQLNDEFHDYLAQRTAMRCMEAIGHTEDMTNMSKKLMDLERAFNEAISPRERGDIKAILQEDFFYDRRF